MVEVAGARGENASAAGRTSLRGKSTGHDLIAHPAVVSNPVSIDDSLPRTRACAIRSRSGPPDRPPRTGSRRLSGRPGRPVLAAAGPSRPGRGRGVGRHRAEDRVRPGLPAAGHLALSALGHCHHPPGVEAYAAYALRAWLARDHMISAGTRRSPSGLRSVPSRSVWPGKSPTIWWPRPGSHGRRGRSPPSCPACRSWSWPWGPRWRTCCAPMLRPWIRQIAEPGSTSPSPAGVTSEYRRSAATASPAASGSSSSGRNRANLKRSPCRRTAAAALLQRHRIPAQAAPAVSPCPRRPRMARHH